MKAPRELGYLLIGSLLCASQVFAYPAAPSKPIIYDKIVIEKSKRLMSVFHQEKLLKTYPIDLGFSPIGPKQVEGDGKTPEGQYFISYKNPNSRFHLSLKLSYPSPDDIQRAKGLGLSAGGDIMIHGARKHLHHQERPGATRDWTLGCIATSNAEMEELYQYVSLGTPVHILP